MDDDSGFRINTEYAAKYNTWRQKEELQKLKDRYGDVEIDEDTTSSESEDDDAEALTEEVEKGWLKAYAAVKTRDPKIYSKEVKFYNSDDEKSPEEETSRMTKEKPVYLKDYERKVILEKGGQLSDEESDSEEGNEEEYKGPSYYEEQDEIRQSIKAAINDSDEDSDSELLHHRKKTKEEKEQEEADYLQWLKGQKEEPGDTIDSDLSSLKKYWNKPDLDEGEKFLRDYILNKKYIDKDDEDRIPMYHEIVNEDENDFDEEEKELEKQEEFERKYNFRFEEPDAELIKSYPRTIEASVRRKDEKRTKKRKELKERKEQEKNRKKEEIKQLKNLKKQEILNKLEKLKEITGNPSVGFSKKDIEADFDPAEYDKMMQQVFDEDYYGGEEEETKPEFLFEEDLGVEESYDDWSGYQEEPEGEDSYTEPHCEDADFIMDADYDPSQDQKEKKKKKKSKFVEAVLKKKPVFEPSDKTFEEYFDEYYKLDYEDIIGDTPCRFKYRQVIPNSFGLSTEEVLTARDKELNRWVSLKKAYQYRTEEEEKYDVKVYTKKGENVQKKLSILTSLTEKNEDSKPAATLSSNKGFSKPNEKKQKKKKNSFKGQEVFLENKTELGERPKKCPKGEEDTVKLSPQNNSSKRSEKRAKKKCKQNVDKEMDKNTTVAKISANTEPKVKRKIDEKVDVKEVLHHKRQKIDPTGGGNSEAVGVTTSTESESKHKRKRKRKKQNSSSVPVPEHGKNEKKKKRGSNFKKNQMSEERLKAYGINPKKFKYMNIHKAKQPS
ncbi:protein KRI1 homolog [Lingula anatina]|uniref:Protein KRI1 homolog n=1 Tax=Lingula anatina TaxID=7574 RepID=A0A1S3K500_LINAN|nr:protein KRI1 homolog [Lingula anatina]|eukprot:XP_013417705.1 protein KRI1 homolog [Lingula anatina]